MTGAAPPPGPDAGAPPPFTEFPRSALEEPIGALFERQVARHAGRPAVSSGGRVLTYAELDRSANRLARAILARRGTGLEPIALLLAHDAPVLAAILAVLKAGKIYVALDAHHATPRLAAILADSEAPLIVCDAANHDRARALIPPRGALLDVTSLDDAAPDGPLGLSISARTPASICYTSGSTGRPKGVVWDHRGIVHRVMLFVQSARIGPDDRVALLQSVAVGAAYRRIFGALLTGAAVHPFDLRGEGADALAPWLVRERITVCSFAASVFRHFATGLEGAGLFPALRWLWLGSEAVLKSDVELYRAHFSPACVFASGLSTSEAGSLREFIIDETTPLDGAVVPVGYPQPDKEILPLGEDGHAVEAGEVGEIAVRSEYLALGYWRRPDLDRTVFLPDPMGGPARIYRTGDLGRMRPDGCLVHLGRKDARAKLAACPRAGQGRGSSAGPPRRLSCPCTPTTPEPDRSALARGLPSIAPVVRRSSALLDSL